MQSRFADLFDKLTGTHALLIALQSRDKGAPLPEALDKLLDECEEELSTVRDALAELAAEEGKN